MRLVLSLLACLVALVVVSSANAAVPDLPLGPPGLDQERESRALGGGVTWTRVRVGAASAQDRFTVDVAVLDSRAEARTTARAVRDAGFDARLERFAGPLGPLPRAYRVWVVRSGVLASQAEATALQDRLRAAGYDGARAVFTGDDGRPTSGPWLVNVLEVDPSRVSPVLATGVVVDRATTSAIAAATGAAAGINGGYFVIGGPGDGDPAGAYVLDGELVSETIDGRTTLVLDRGRAGLARLGFGGTVSVGGATRDLDGVERIRGEIRNCGGRGGDQPTERPRHDTTCTDASELIRLSPVFGSSTRTGPDGVEAIVRGGVVTEVREGGDTTIPADGYVLSGSGDGAQFLRDHAAPGARPEVQAALRDGVGRTLALGPGANVVNGGPRLVAGGRPFVTSAAEGFVYPDDPGFYYRFGIRRNPRTLAGVRPDGTLVLVTVDGRLPGVSVGASFAEEARLMVALGARDALNLDGGGSTTFTVGGTVVNRPSDATGERPVSDGLFVTP